MKVVTVCEFGNQRNTDKDILLDVRSPAEYDHCHPEGAVNVPLDRLDPCEFMKTNPVDSGGMVYLICQSGTRARMACEKFEKAGFCQVAVVEGGLNAWKQAGLPVVEGEGKGISVERQARIVIGTMVILGVLTGWFVHPAGFVFSAAVGAGLIYAGVTDTCAIAILLSRMPWNQDSKGIRCCSVPVSEGRSE